MERTIVGIDVGTTKICTLVGEVNEAGELNIVGVGVAPSRGMRKGMVINVAEATEAIAASVEKAERTSGYQIERAYVSIAGSHISGVNSRGVVAISRGEGGITTDDIDRALEAAQAIAIPHNQEVLHIVPRTFTVDGQNGIRDPIGMYGFRLEVEAHIVMGASSAIQNLVKCVEALDIGVVELVLGPLAAGAAVLTDTEREMGVVLADIGGGTTDIGVFIEGSVWHTSVLAVGGNHLTNDLAIGLRAPFTVAENLKIEYGQARSDAVGLDETVEVDMFGDNGHQRVSRRLLAQILEARAEEICHLIRQEIKRSGYDGLLPAGVVLCGGSAQLAGFPELAREVLQLPVRVGAPRDLKGLVDTISSPAFATSVGLLRWGLQQHTVRRPRRRGGSLGQRLIQWLRAFLPG